MAQALSFNSRDMGPGPLYLVIKSVVLHGTTLLNRLESIHTYFHSWFS